MCKICINHKFLGWNVSTDWIDWTYAVKQWSPLKGLGLSRIGLKSFLTIRPTLYIVECLKDRLWSIFSETGCISIQLSIQLEICRKIAKRKWKTNETILINRCAEWHWWICYYIFDIKCIRRKKEMKTVKWNILSRQVFWLKNTFVKRPTICDIDHYSIFFYYEWVKWYESSSFVECEKGNDEKLKSKNSFATKISNRLNA